MDMRDESRGDEVEMSPSIANSRSAAPVGGAGETAMLGPGKGLGRNQTTTPNGASAGAAREDAGGITSAGRGVAIWAGRVDLPGCFLVGGGLLLLRGR